MTLTADRIEQPAMSGEQKPAIHRRVLGRLNRVWNHKVFWWLLFLFTLNEVGDNLWALASAMIEQSSVDVSQEFVSIEEVLFTMPVCLGAILLFTRRLDSKLIMIAFLMAHFDNHFGFTDYHLHGFLDENQIYPLALRRGDPNVAVNIQYAVLSVYAVVYFSLWFTVLWPKKRSFERVFILIVMSVMLGTTVLFHQVFIHNALVSEYDQARTAKREHIAALAQLPDEVFMAQCARLRVSCQVGVLNQDAIALENPWMEQALDNAINQVQSNRTLTTQNYSQAILVSTLQGDLRGNQLILHRYDAGDIMRYRFALDTSEYTHIPNRHKIHFTWLMIVAHSWWIGGGLLLVAFHRRRFKNRFPMRPQATAEAGG